MLGILATTARELKEKKNLLQFLALLTSSSSHLMSVTAAIRGEGTIQPMGNVVDSQARPRASSIKVMIGLAVLYSLLLSPLSLWEVQLGLRV